jgi:hypothetical protein
LHSDEIPSRRAWKIWAPLNITLVFSSEDSGVSRDAVGVDWGMMSNRCKWMSTIRERRPHL